jgi:flagellin-like hook-associated protein FlgL
VRDLLHGANVLTTAFDPRRLAAMEEEMHEAAEAEIAFATRGDAPAQAETESGITDEVPEDGSDAATEEQGNGASTGDDPIAGEKGIRGRVTKQSEEAIGKLAQGMLEHPVVTGAVSAAFDARARAIRAQEATMAALNLPSASDVERLTRRLRNVSQRMEAIEESLDSLDERLQRTTTGSVQDRLDAIEASLARIERVLGTAPGGSAPHTPPPLADAPPPPADAPSPPTDPPPVQPWG